LQINFEGLKVAPKRFGIGIRYCGHKRGLGPDLLNNIYKHAKSSDFDFYDLFGGGGSMSLLARSMGHETHYNDYDSCLFELFNECINGKHFEPHFIGHDEYKSITSTHSKEAIFYGCIFGFNQYETGGYFCRKECEPFFKEEFDKYLKGEKHHPRLSRILAQYKHFNNIGLNRKKYGFDKIITTNQDYKKVEVSDKGLIYCDIPYVDINPYEVKLDHNEFYEWALSVDKAVYVSEYTMPDDFKLIWQEERDRIHNINGKIPRKEKLFWNHVKF
jgi:site-specific DNA-adenine methylase